MGFFNLGSFLTGGGGLPGLESFWGNSLYRSSGAESSAKQQYKHQLALQQDAQNFAKWQMGNAHQIEVQDLQNAGLNPVLSAGGSGAKASVSEGSATAGTPIIDPISAISTIVGTMNSAKSTNAQVENLEADANVKTAEAYRILQSTDPDIQKTLAERNYYIQQMKTAKSQQDINEAQKGLVEWESRHPVLAKILPGSVGAAASLASAGIMGKAMQLGTKSRINNAKQPKVEAGKVYTNSPLPTQKFPEYW